MFRPVFWFSAAALMIAAPCAIAPRTAAAQTAPPERHVTLRVSYTVQPMDPDGLGLARFKEMVEKETNGTVTVATFPANQLGGENQVLQAVKQGSIQMALTAAGTVGNLIPDISVLDAPYLWKDWAAEKKVLSGPVFQHFRDELAQKEGIRLLSATWLFGLRNLTCNKPIRTPAEAAGLKIRTPPAPVNLLSARVLGGQGVPMDFAQVYLALKTGTIDCQENPLPVTLSYKVYEVSHYIMLTQHLQQSQVITMNLALWDSLSKHQQDVIQNAIDVAGDYVVELTQKVEADDVAKLEAMPDVHVIKDIDKGAFVARARQLDPELKSAWGDLYDRILAEQEKK